MNIFNEVLWPIAAKPHRCEWCGEGIETREQHAHFVGTWDGEFQNWRMHSECYNDADDNDGLAEGFMPYAHTRPAVASAPQEPIK